MSSSPPGTQRSVDRAALLGTSMAAVVALTFGGQGAWQWLASVVGLVLLVVLLAFFHLPADGSVREIAALSGVAALCATLVVATPMQVLLAATTSIGGDCAASGAAAAARVVASDRGVLDGALVARAAYEAADAASGLCLGNATSAWLGIPAVVLAGAIYGVCTLVASRRRRASAGTEPSVSARTPG